MANAVFTASESSIYDDLIESRYHFPATYRRQVEAALGDWIVYYEPRRTAGPNSASGRQAYFAVAQVADITPDPARDNHFYAHLINFLEFDQPVGFRSARDYYESGLQKADGSTNRGAFACSAGRLERCKRLFQSAQALRLLRFDNAAHCRITH